MRFALINPPWNFEGSIYFGCREPHLPLEFGYSKALLEAQGHECLLIDGQLDQLTQDEVVERAKIFRPDFSVVTIGAELFVLAMRSTRDPHTPATVRKIAAARRKDCGGGPAWLHDASANAAKNRR